MNCPICQAGLEPVRVTDVDVKQCPNGHGMWFERDQLRRAKDNADPHIDWMDFDIWSHAEHFRLAEKPSTCPECGKEMATIEYGDTKVQVDVCPACRGIWLDEGEFARIVEALRQEANAKSVPDYLHASLKEAGDIVSGDESLMSEWRDLKHVVTMFEYRLFSKHPKLLTTLLNVGRANPLD